jgi:hypothetical protein
MKYTNSIVFWSDVSIVAVESIMSQQGDTKGMHYQNVRSATEDIVKHMINKGLTKEILQNSIGKFLEIRQEFSASELSSSAPADLVPAVLVAMCVQNTIEEDINDDLFGDLVAEAYNYLAKYNFK